MDFDKRTIKRFLSSLNGCTKIARVKLKENTDRIITFETRLKKDFFISGGITNFTDNYTLTIKEAVKIYFNYDNVSFNNTGHIFWIIK